MMEPTLLLLLGFAVPATALLMAAGLEADRRRRPRPSLVARGQRSRRTGRGERHEPVAGQEDVVLRGATVFLRRLDPWTVGADCMLGPPSGDGSMPAHLRLRCPVSEWHQATVVVAALVNGWMARGDALDVEVSVLPGRHPRARLNRADAAVVLDVENPIAVREACRLALVAGRLPDGMPPRAEA